MSATIRQGQTATFYIYTDLESIDRATVTVESGGASRKLEPTVEGGMLEIQLSEADTLAMPAGNARMQVKALVGDEVAVSNVMALAVLDTIDKGAIS